jgi:hypothetical protein
MANNNIPIINNASSPSESSSSLRGLYLDTPAIVAANAMLDTITNLLLRVKELERKVSKIEGEQHKKND